jgi:predicted DCC family thiol-disulfide oxidoreductase YuxK
LSRTPILYDRDCGFCRVSCALVLALDRRRRLRPVAIQSEEGERLLAGMPEERRLDSWHLVTGAAEVASGGEAEGGAVRSAGAAFPPLLRLLGAGPLATLLERFPRVAERGYRFVADRRSPLGRRIPAVVKRSADRTVERRA